MMKMTWKMTVLALILFTSIIAITGCGSPSHEETAACERAVSLVAVEMRLEQRYLLGFGNKYDDNIHKVQKIKFNFAASKWRDKQFLTGETLAEKEFWSLWDEVNKKCTLETVPGMAGKKINDLPDDTPIYRCRYHKNHVITAKELK